MPIYSCQLKICETVSTITSPIAITVRQPCGNCWLTVGVHQVSDFKVTSGVNCIPVMAVVTFLMYANCYGNCY